MSIEAHVFTADIAPVAIRESIADLAQVGIEAKVLRSFRDLSTYVVAEVGSLENGDIVCAWLRETSVAKEIGAAVVSRDRPSIERFLVEGNLGSCSVYVRQLVAIPPHERVELAEVDGGADLIEAMREATLDYDATSAAGRNDLTILLQFRVTQVIAKLRGGVWTDPVSGDYLVVQRGRWERLPCLEAYEAQ